MPDSIRAEAWHEENAGDHVEAPMLVPCAVVKAYKRGRVWDKCGGRCHYCGCELHPFWSLTIDHLIPKSRGGTNAIENLVAACPDCNHAKGDSLVYVPADVVEGYTPRHEVVDTRG